MPSFVAWLKTLADEFASLGTLEAFYVRLGDDLVAVRPSSSHPRRLKSASALMRTLTLHSGILLTKGPEGGPFPDALLRELGAEAAVLIRDRGGLVALACLANTPTSFDDESAARIAAHCAEGLRRFPGAALRKALRPHPFRTLAGVFFR
ncbi:MAG: hypothetical protein JRH01_10365 [Deltaproteobacteria bacterium]|nr:hypothetical protein [Deltaproteobacteria bacterium]MBW2392733.1 hypothetical protein [Deltaproteobacteria bacterium]